MQYQYHFLEMKQYFNKKQYRRKVKTYWHHPISTIEMREFGIRRKSIISLISFFLFILDCVRARLLRIKNVKKKIQTNSKREAETSNIQYACSCLIPPPNSSPQHWRICNVACYKCWFYCSLSLAWMWQVEMSCFPTGHDNEGWVNLPRFERKFV